MSLQLQFQGVRDAEIEGNHCFRNYNLEPIFYFVSEYVFETKERSTLNSNEFKKSGV